MEITQARVRELLHYDPETGVFTWRVTPSGRPGHNRIVGTVCSGRSSIRLHIRIDGRIYKAHRLAFLYMAGRWPTEQVDHRDGDGLNNRWSNLREATQSQNKQNTRAAYKNNRSSGLLGVYRSPNKYTNKWFAGITIDHKFLYLGNFPSTTAAHASYLAAKRRFHEFAVI